MDEGRRISPMKALKNAGMGFSGPFGYMEWDNIDIDGVLSGDAVLIFEVENLLTVWFLL